MKRTTFLLLALLLLNHGRAQEAKDVQEKTRSKLENIIMKSGVLTKKQFFNLGDVKNTKIDVMVITEITSKRSYSGVRMEKLVSKSYGSVTKTCFIDNDEIESLMAAGHYLLQEQESPPGNYVEYEFRSRSGFKSGMFKEKSDWRYFIQLDYSEDSMIFLNKDDYNQLMVLLAQAKKQMVDQ